MKPGIMNLHVFFLFTATFANISFQLPHNTIEVRESSQGTIFSAASLGGPAGAPELPVCTYTFLLPPTADLNTCHLEMINITEKIMEGPYEIAPVPPPVRCRGKSANQNNDFVNKKNMSIYRANTYFPKNQA